MAGSELCADCKERDALMGKVQDHLGSLGDPTFDSGVQDADRTRNYHCQVCDMFWSYTQLDIGASNYRSVIHRAE